MHNTISIHAPREGGDILLVTRSPLHRDFNPRPPRGGRPGSPRHWCAYTGFQSTPPARGATLPDHATGRNALHFNPRPPRGGRRHTYCRIHSTQKFQSTPPARGATHPHDNDSKQNIISIHAPREGGDGLPQGLSWPRNYFNPRPPRGGRHGTAIRSRSTRGLFQSTPPARGATQIWILI